MEEENNELEENFLSRWSKKKSKQKTQIENSNSKQIDQKAQQKQKINHLWLKKMISSTMKSY